MLDEKLSHERILICVALVLCALIIGYNAFFVPEVDTPTIIYADSDYVSSSNLKEKDIMDDDTSPDIEIVYENGKEYNDESQNYNSDSKVNINTADVDELCEGLDGIGETMANRIVEYREENGDFTSIDDITNVKGIGESTFDKIKDNICI